MTGLRSAWQLFVSLGLFFLLCGCGAAHPTEAPKPPMGAGEGAIEGRLCNADGLPFDLKLATPAGSLQIHLINPDRAVVATVSPQPDKPRFIFDHVKPGTYELSVYLDVRGKRTIAGSEPVTVDAGQITPATLTLQVTEDDKVKG